MRPIAAFDRPPIRLWERFGLDCAVYAGYRAGLNGYVRLPEEHPERVIAEAMDVVEAERRAEFRQRLGLGARNDKGGYDHIDADAPGGLTYGPDEEGWVGFDTAHFNDVWEDEEVRRVVLPVDPEAYYRRKEVDLVLGEDAWLALAGEYAIRWTFDKVVEAVDLLAAQLAGVVSPDEARLRWN